MQGKLGLSVSSHTSSSGGARHTFLHHRHITFDYFSAIIEGRVEGAGNDSHWRSLEPIE